MATDFGKALQELRRKEGLTLYDVAQRLEVSSAFVSAIEHGRKRVPDDFMDRLVRVVPQVVDRYQDLVVLANQARKEVVVPLAHATRSDVDLATALARKFNNLSAEQKAQIRSILDRKE